MVWFFSGFVIVKYCVTLSWNQQKDFSFSTFSSFWSQVVCNCATEAFRFFCSCIRGRFEAALGQNQCSWLCVKWLSKKLAGILVDLQNFQLSEAAKQKNPNNQKKKKKKRVMKTAWCEIGKLHYEAILSKWRSLCPSSNTDCGVVQFYLAAAILWSLSGKKQNSLKNK